MFQVYPEQDCLNRQYQEIYFRVYREKYLCNVLKKESTYPATLRCLEIVLIHAQQILHSITTASKLCMRNFFIFQALHLNIPIHNKDNAELPACSSKETPVSSN